MKLALMQPYLFPYLGYLQLIAAVDEFVVYDDAQFIKGGWIHRNRILVDGAPSWITLPVEGASTYAPIRARSFAEPFDAHKERIVRQLADAYAEAPHREEVLRLVQQMFAAAGERNVATFVEHTLRALCDHLAIDTPITRASDLPDGEARGQDRVLDIATAKGATTYVNSAGGRELYDAAAFAERGVLLRFLEMDQIRYDQGGVDFVPSLSILDVLMFVPRDEVRALLGRCTVS